MTEYVEVCNGDFHYQISDRGVTKTNDPDVEYEPEPHWRHHLKAIGMDTAAYQVLDFTLGKTRYQQNEHGKRWYFSMHYIVEQLGGTEYRVRKGLERLRDLGFAWRHDGDRDKDGNFTGTWWQLTSHKDHWQHDPQEGVYVTKKPPNPHKY